jgi:hypothetical protein
MNSDLCAAATALAAALTISAAAGAASAGPNLVVNGDFSAGNTGFSTEYALTTMTPYLFQDGVHGIYAVEAANAVAGSSAYGDWTNVTTDPSGGNGNLFVADGATTDPAATVWSETVAVNPHTNYTFSFDAAEISNACCSNAQFLPTVNATNGTVLDLNGAWQSNSTFVWNSGSSTSAVLSLTDLNESGPYNDFVLDDISFSTAGVPEPATWAMMLIGFAGLGAAIRSRRKPVAAAA